MRLAATAFAVLLVAQTGAPTTRTPPRGPIPLDPLVQCRQTFTGQAQCQNRQTGAVETCSYDPNSKLWRCRKK